MPFLIIGMFLSKAQETMLILCYTWRCTLR